ncbi:MAG: thioredoxin-disulfide reductase [Deltaproteobacteria bacterium]|nr:thioredoxin-disulfide reductase [Deltaproteobacteria bacterium]
MASETKTDVRNVVIVGGGPAGYTAAIYAARAAASPLLIEGWEPGGQLMTTTEIENFPGFKDSIEGPALMAEMKAQAERVGTDFITDAVESVDLSSRPFRVKTGTAEVLAKTLIIATGAKAKWLGIESEQTFMGRGVSACATCDGFFYRDKVVAVVGGGDTACEEAIYLTNHATKVYLVHRRDELRASKIMADRLLKNPKIEPVWFSAVDEILGDNSGVTGVRLRNTKDGSTRELAIDGIFMAIGHQPMVEFLGGQLELTKTGNIKTAPDSTRTSVKGVFAAGDVQDSVYRQAITAAGTGCMAAIEATRLLEEDE